jgi:hypothetical protein
MATPATQNLHWMAMTFVGAGLLANALVQALQGRRFNWVRQQAGSYRIGFARKHTDSAGLAFTTAVVAIR